MAEQKLVQIPSDTLLTERDADKLPILRALHLGIDFGGLTAVDDFNINLSTYSSALQLTERVSSPVLISGLYSYL